MSPRIIARTAWLATLLLAASCGSTSNPSGGGKADSVNPDVPRSRINPNAPTIVIALDASESMLDSDPERFSVEGARLAGALIETGANVGILSFNRRAQTHFELASLRSNADREKLEAAVKGVRFRGQTDFANALKASYNMLVEQNAPRGSSVLFLTDGRPDLGTDEVSAKNVQAATDTLSAFKQNGYRVFTIGLGSDINVELLNQISAETGAPPTWLVGQSGTSGKESAKQLLNAFLQVTGDVNKFLEFDEGLAPVEIFPGTRKLVYVMVRDDVETRFGTVRRDEGVVPDRGYYKYPRDDRADTRFQVVFVDAPEAGIWEVDTHGKPEIGAILEDVALDVELAKLAKERYHVGDGIPLSIVAKFQHPGWQKILGERARASADLVSAETGKVLAKDVPLLAEGAMSGRVAFRGEPIARQSRPGDEERIFANVRFVLTRRTRGESSRKFSTSVLVRPHPGANLTATPDVLDLGPRWSDQPSVATLSILNPTSAEIAVVAKGTDVVAIEPASFSLGSGDSQTVKVTLADGADVGAFREKLTFVATPTRGSSESKTLEVAVNGTVYALKNGAKVALGSCPVDPKATHTEKLPVPIVVEPSSPGLFRVETTEVTGPAKLAASIESAGTVSTLSVRIPPETPRGDYAVHFTVKPKVPGLADRDVVGRLTVNTVPEVAVVPPAVVKVDALGSREVDAVCRLTLDYPTDGAELIVGKGSLSLDGDGPAITPDDYELVYGDDWDGKTLVAGRSYELRLRIYVSSDIRNGDYRGELTLTYRRSGHPDGLAVVPVTVRVAR